MKPDIERDIETAAENIWCECIVPNGAKCDGHEALDHLSTELQRLRALESAVPELVQAAREAVEEDNPFIRRQLNRLDAAVKPVDALLSPEGEKP